MWVIIGKAYAIIKIEGVWTLLNELVTLCLHKIYEFYILNRFNSSLTPSDKLPVILEVDPSRITHISTLNSHKFPTNDRRAQKYNSPTDDAIVGIISGPWDRCKIKWYHDNLTRYINHKYDNNSPRKESKYYQYKKYTSEWSDKKCSLNERMDDLDNLYYSMKNRGYIRQKEFIDGNSEHMYLGSPRRTKIQGKWFPDECRVGIGRNGELIRFNSGKHRVTIAKTLSIEKVPVIVVVRHSHWEQIREHFSRAQSIEDVPKKYRKYADHPDISFSDASKK